MQAIASRWRCSIRWHSDTWVT